MKTVRIIKLLLTLLIGTMFITTAIAKLISLVQFELYIYSFNLFSYVFCSIIARLLIAFEFLVGLFLILKIYYKYTWWLCFLSLLGFSVFLVYVILFRSDANCHCFGDLIELDPNDSLIKNIITIILLLFIRKAKDYRIPYKKVIALLSIALVTVVLFCAFPMDMLYSKFVSNRENVNTIAFDEAKANSVFYNKLIIDNTSISDSIVYSEDTIPWNINHGKYIINVVSSGCKYCKIGIEKAKLIIEKNKIDKNKFKLAIWGRASKVSSFIKETETWEYDYYLISPVDAINIVYGEFPTFLWIEDGKVINAGNYKEIDESHIVDFLK